MKILDRYLIKRLFKIGLFALLVFTVCWLAPEIMFKAIQGISRGELTSEQGLLYLFYQVPEVFIYSLPISALFASVFLFRQLSLSGELITILSSGISFRRILIPIGVVGLSMTLFYILTQELLLPLASSNLRELSRITRFDSQKMVINPQVTFVERSKTGNMEKFLVITPDALEAQNKFIFLFYKGKGDSTRIARILTATDGIWNNRRNVWELKDGVDYLLSADGIYRHIESFEARSIRTSPVAQALLSFPTGNPSEFTTKQLEKYTRLLIKGGQTEEAKFYQVRLYQRYLLPLIPLMFALLGTAIGVEHSRARRNMGLTYAAVLLLFYNITVPTFTTIASMGLLPTFIAAISPLLLALAVGGTIIRLRKSEG